MATTSIGSCHECVATLTLPLALFLLLAETAVGGIATVAYLRISGGLTHGFLKFVASTYLVLGLLALLVVWAGPPANYHSLLPINQPVAGLLVFFQALLVVAILGLLILIWRQRDATTTGWILSMAAGALLLAGISAVLWPLTGSVAGGAALVAVVILSTVVLGAATTGMLLGHWYLVTPALTNRPLFRAIAVLLVGLVMQAIAFPFALAALAHSSGSLGQAFSLSPPLSILWALGSVILPLMAAAPALLTCRLRSFMSTTGLLYLAMIVLLPGQLLGQLLFFVAASN